MANAQMDVADPRGSFAPATASPTIESARRHLAEARAALEAEIQAYPTPISGCDAQYNGLLADRRRIQAAIRALDADIHIPTPRAP